MPVQVESAAAPSGDSAVPLESVLCTEELTRRPARPPDYEGENRALVLLAQALADSPDTILQKMTEIMLETFRVGSSGCSFLTEEDGGKRCYWPAIAGVWKAQLSVAMPRNFSPCGDALDRDAPLLFRNIERRYTYFQPVTPPVEECLLVPFYVKGKAVGTIWLAAHEASRTFDAEDRRQLVSIARFASAAFQTVAFQGKTVAMNEALLLGSLRQHELRGEAENLNGRYKAEIVAKEKIATELAATARGLSVQAREIAEKARLIDLSNDAIIVRDLHNKIRLWNKGAEKLFGWTLAEVKGKDLHALLHTEFPKPHGEIIAQLHREGRFNGEVVQIARDGRRVRSLCGWVLDRETESIFTSYTDITERTKALEALRQNEWRLRYATESARLTYVEMDFAGGGVRRGAENYAAVMGFGHPDGRDADVSAGAELLLTHVVPDDRPRVKAALQEFIAGHPLGKIVFRVLGDDQIERWIETRWSAQLGPDGKPLKSFATHLDITEQKQAEEALRVSEERYRTLFDSMDEGFCVIEMIFDEQEKPVDYRYLEINPSFEKLTGMHGALGKRVGEFVPDLEAYWYEVYGNVARTGIPIRVADEVKGMNRWFDIYACRIGEKDSRQLAIFFRNITESKQVERHTGMLTALSRELAGATEEAEIIKIAVEAAGRHLNGHRCYFVECLADENRLLVSHNWVRDDAPSIEGELSLFDFGGLDWWREFASGDLIIEDVATNPLTQAKSASYHAVGVPSYAVQPFRRAGDWTVCLAVTEKSPRKWTAYDLRVLDDVVARVWPLVERARADRALRGSEAQLRLALDSAELGSWNMDPVTNALSSDARFRAIFGVTAEDFSYEHAFGVIHPDDRHDVTRAVAAAIRPEGPVPYETEYRVVHPDGSLHWVFAKGRANFGGDAAGRKLLSFDGTVADITDRKRAEMNFSFLASVSEDLANLTGVDDVMALVGAKIGAHLELSACAFVEVDEAAGQVVISNDWHREDVPGLVGTYRQADFFEEEFTRMARAGEIIVIRDTAADARTAPEKFVALKVASFICAPLIRDGQWRFALCLYQSTPHPWRNDEVELARELTVRLWTRLERLRAEAELRESEERYRNLFNSIDEGFCIIELIYDGEEKPVDYRYLEVNPSFEKQTGMKNAAGRRVLEILPNLEPYWLEYYGNVARSGEPLRFVNYAKGWDRWFDVYGFRIGEPGSYRVAILFTDVSSRERNELARSYQAKLLAAIAETTGQLLIADSPLSLLDSIFGRLAQVLGAEVHLSHLVSEDGTRLMLKGSSGLDAEQRRTYAQQPFEPPQIAPGEGSAQPFFPDMAPICAAHEATMTRAFGARAVVCLPLRVGRRVFGTFSLASALREPFDEQELRFIHTVCDLVAASMERARLIHAVRGARDVAEQANISKDLFLAGLSHELRTPLTPVLLLAAEAIEDPTMPVAAREIFTTIERNVKLEARLIDDLLDVTRISHGKLALEMQVVEVHVPLRDALETVASELKEKRIELKLNLEAEKPLVMGDPVRLQQIFWNVLRNAVKFSPTEGEILVETAILTTGRLSIKIADRGMGMTKEELARLFASFSQGDHAGGGGSHRFGGLGLGLSISRRLAELHSGTIRAESAGLNEGSTFLIELPLNQPAGVKEFMRSPEPPAPRRTVSQSGELPVLRRILLVEDHEATRTALAQLLTRRRYEVVGVGSLAEARAAFSGASFDLLISDLGLPDGTGHELMGELRTRFGLTGIALTGYGRDEDVARGREAGFVTHLTKPVSLQLLEVALAAAAAGRAGNRK